MIPPKKKENGYNNNKVNDFSAMEAPYSSFTAPQKKTQPTQKEMMETANAATA